MKNLLISSLAALALGLCGAAAAEAATFSDPAGDNCAGGQCGPDLTAVGHRLGADGTLFLSVTRNGSTCSTLSYPATEVQPMFVLFAAGATSPGDTASLRGRVWAASTTRDFVWSKPGSTGSDDEVALVSTVTPGSVEVAVPPAIVASTGGLPLKLWVTDSCREFPFDPETASKDLAPDTGLYTLEAPDVCPNLPGAQGAVPAGLSVDAAGACVADVCPDLAGVQAAVPAGYAKDGAGGCVPVAFTGSAGRDRLVGNALANVLSGLGGADRLLGKAGADRLLGGGGPDTLVGGPGRDRHLGGAGNDTIDARDRARGDVVDGGAGVDVCRYDAGDVVKGCERRIPA